MSEPSTDHRGKGFSYQQITNCARRKNSTETSSTPSNFPCQASNSTSRTCSTSFWRTSIVDILPNRWADVRRFFRTRPRRFGPSKAYSGWCDVCLKVRETIGFTTSANDTCLRVVSTFTSESPASLTEVAELTMGG